MKDFAYPNRQRFLNSCKPLPERLQEKLDAALDYLGEHWILTEPINRLTEPEQEIPMFLRRQAS